MKTHIDVDGALLQAAIELGGFKSKKAAVNAALDEYVRALRRRALLDLRGKVQWEGDLDALRANRVGRDP